MNLKRKLSLLVVLVTFVLVAVMPASAQDTELSIVWFAWPPCDLLDTITDDYEAATVNVTCVPIGQWYDQIFLDFAAGGGAARAQRVGTSLIRPQSPRSCGAIAFRTLAEPASLARGSPFAEIDRAALLPPIDDASPQVVARVVEDCVAVRYRDGVRPGPEGVAQRVHIAVRADTRITK